jgi:hypothetical protein
MKRRKGGRKRDANNVTVSRLDGLLVEVGQFARMTPTREVAAVGQAGKGQDRGIAKKTRSALKRGESARRCTRDAPLLMTLVT